MIELIFFGNEPKWPVYLQKQPKNYSNGSATKLRKLKPKQFERDSKRLAKILEKRKKNERT